MNEGKSEVGGEPSIPRTFVRVVALAAAFALPVWPLTAVQQDQPREQTNVGEENENVVEVPPLAELLKTLERGSTWEREAAAAWLVEYPEQVDEFAAPLARFFLEFDEALNRVADKVFAYYGERAVAAIEPLFHPEAQEALADNESWRMACAMIRAIGDPARGDYESRLVDILRESRDWRVRVPAIYALTGFSGGSPDAIESIVIDLQHENFNVNNFAAKLVIASGPAARTAVPELRRLLTEGGISQRSHAAWALGAIGPVEDFDPLPALAPMLDAVTIVERERALLGIGLMGRHAQSLEPKIRDLMASRSNLDAAAAYVVWQMTGDTETTVPRLAELARTPELEFAAVEYLQKMGSAAKDATACLLERSRSGDFSLRASAVETLAAVQTGNVDVANRLDELESDPHPLVRLAVRRARQREQADSQ